MAINDNECMNHSYDCTAFWTRAFPTSDYRQEKEKKVQRNPFRILREE